MENKTEKEKVLFFTAPSFRKPKRWISAIMAFVFLFQTLSPAWAREGNYGETKSWEMFAVGGLASAVTNVCILWGGSGDAGLWGAAAVGAGSVASDLTGYYMYRNYYNTSGESVIEFDLFGVEVNISKQAFWSMVAGVVAGAAVGAMGGAANGVKGTAGGAVAAAIGGGVFTQIIVNTVVIAIPRILESALLMMFFKWWEEFLVQKLGWKRMWAQTFVSIANVLLTYLASGTEADKEVVTEKDAAGNYIVKDGANKDGTPKTKTIEGKETDNKTFRADNGKTYAVVKGKNGQPDQLIEIQGAGIYLLNNIISVVAIFTGGAGVKSLLQRVFSGIATQIGRVFGIIGKNDSLVFSRSGFLVTESSVKEVTESGRLSALLEAAKKDPNILTRVEKEDIPKLDALRKWFQATGGISNSQSTPFSFSGVVIAELRETGYLGPLSAVLTTLTLDLLGYDEYHGKDKKKIYNELIKTIIAQGVSSYVTGTIADWNSSSETSQNLIHSFSLLAKQAGITAAQIGLNRWTRDSSLHPALKGMMHLAGAGIAGATIDAASRQGDEPEFSASKFLSAIPDNFNNYFIRAALETMPGVYPLSTGVEQQANQAGGNVYDEDMNKYIRRMEMATRGIGPTQQVAMILGQNLTRYAAIELGESVSDTVSRGFNTILPADYQLPVKDVEFKPAYQVTAEEIELKENDLNASDEQISARESAQKALKWFGLIPVLGAGVKIAAGALVGIADRGYAVLPDVIKGGTINYRYEVNKKDNTRIKHSWSAGVYQPIEAFSEKGSLTEITSVDSFGRPIKTSYYDGQGIALDKTTTYHGPYAGKFFLTKDYTKIESADNSPSERKMVTETITEEMQVENSPATIERGYTKFDIPFKFGKYDLTPDGKAELDKVVEEYKKNPSAKIMFSAHADKRGSKKLNDNLTDQRLISPEEYLVAAGIPEGSIIYRGSFGKDAAMISGVESHEARQQDRVVIITVITEKEIPAQPVYEKVEITTTKQKVNEDVFSPVAGPTTIIGIGQPYTGTDSYEVLGETYKDGKKEILTGSYNPQIKPPAFLGEKTTYLPSGTSSTVPVTNNQFRQELDIKYQDQWMNRSNDMEDVLKDLEKKPL